MDIADTRKCNLFNLKTLARYLDVESDVLIGYYQELLDDQEYLDAVNRRIADIKEKWGFNKGIFGMPTISSVDWFAFERILIYVLIRYFKPRRVLETGVYYGGNSAFALIGLAHNECGEMISIDFPDSEIREKGADEPRHSLVGDSELYDPSLRPGFMVPPYLNGRWKLIEGDSLKEIPGLTGEFDLYIHDSDHSMPFLSRELALAWEKLSERAVILVDDIDWSNAFFAFCVKERLFPLMLTDNGKDNLRVRIGIATRGHANNGNDLFT